MKRAWASTSMLTVLAGAATVASSNLGCGEDGNGESDLSVLLVAEETITNGVAVGSAEEDSQDYAVTFTKYLVSLGQVRMAEANGKHPRHDDTVYIADMQRVGEEGVEIATFRDLEAGQWPEFGFATTVPTADAVALGGVTPEDRVQMVEHGWTYWIEGQVERPVEQGGPVSFVLQVPVHSEYYDCASDAEPGVTVMNGPSSATITLHGDHIFFNAFPSGTEGLIKRRAGWIIEADQDGDGHVTSEDLAKIDASVLFTSANGYSLNLPFDGFPLNTALDFVRAQLATQGHLNGEGGCSQRFSP
ncbi:MAG: hypothetical protein QM778_26020 [Myxococcales bacterium]